jgi:integrase
MSFGYLDKHVDVVKEAKLYLEFLAERKHAPSEASKKQYYEIVERLNKLGKTPKTHCTTKNTFYAYRAAWSFVYAARVNNNLILSETINTYEQLIDISKIIKSDLEKLKLFPTDCNFENIKKAEYGLYRSDWQDVKNLAPRSKSKKYQTNKLPSDWRDKIFQKALRQNSKYLDAIAVLSISGCRPAELEDGIGLQLQDDQSIKVIIRSKKTHGGCFGQELRAFTIHSTSVEHVYLINRMQGTKTAELYVSIEKSKNLSEAVRKIGMAVFPKLQLKISPYNYRHTFSADLKRVSTNRENVALALGHCNDKSQRFYASGKKGQGGFAIKEILGTNLVKITGLEGKQALDHISFIKKNSASFSL